MIDDPDYRTLPPVYYARAAKRARMAIVAGALLAVVSLAVILVLLRIADAEDRDGVLLLMLVAATVAGVWGVVNGVGMLRRNSADAG